MGKVKRKVNRAEDIQYWESQLNWIFFKLIKVCPKGFTSNEVYGKAREIDFPPLVLSRKVPAMFKAFVASGNLKRTSDTRISDRNGHSPLWVYMPTKFLETEKQNYEKETSTRIKR